MPDAPSTAHKEFYRELSAVSLPGSREKHGANNRGDLSQQFGGALLQFGLSAPHTYGLSEA
jgi:hypothetical protein